MRAARSSTIESGAAVFRAVLRAEGPITRSGIAGIVGIEYRSACKHIKALVNEGVLIEVQGVRGKQGGTARAWRLDK